jgi:hypothetical protein
MHCPRPRYGPNYSQAGPSGAMTIVLLIRFWSSLDLPLFVSNSQSTLTLGLGIEIAYIYPSFTPWSFVSPFGSILSDPPRY